MITRIPFLRSARIKKPCYSSLQSLQRPFSVSASELQFGQPLHETHPHLLKPGEITPGISALEYAHRRARLAKSLPPNSVAIFAASNVKYRSGAVFYKFHQDPDFLYLTGFNEPDALAVIEKTSDDDQHIFHLYVRPKNPREELWDGPRSGINAADDVFNADETGNVNHLPSILPKIIRKADHVYTDLPKNIITNNTLTRYLSGIEPSRLGGLAQILRDAANVKPVRPLINELRVIKSEAEVLNMRKAGKVSGRAITDAMRQSFTGEKDLDSFLDYRFKQDGCDGPAYIPVIAGGQNALCIHYVHNIQQLNQEDLVLVDAGAEYGGYITDISRTWPVCGKFSVAQRDLYNTVLKVQRTCVSLCHTESGMTLDKLHRIAGKALADGLADLGFDMSNDAIDTLFPHHLGHYIGLDVHDSPGFPRNKPLEKGMCITIEPGVYVPDDERWPAWARGMGIRIEDSICVDESAPFVLTTEAVKEVVDIEALRD
ncbi:xaa-Pro aminopeptidase-like protein [Delitschia confertaspora ATCC 74209]|uniref:Xaa-Pro aminopeptidase n=1 Tax=Delitschia confertaspora ATCC 74209 TaxID=1513339 RepID=A0A9P4JHR1_9PLEO|nr:xaa-Pro aminopeptidase-like protein [Delitschia confertaspora ATCC 74209]